MKYEEGFDPITMPPDLSRYKCENHGDRPATTYRIFPPHVGTPLRMDMIFMCDECEAEWVLAES